MRRREKEKGRQPHPSSDKQRMSIRDVKAMPQRAEYGDRLSRVRRSEELCPTPDNAIDEANLPRLCRGLRDAERTPQECSAMRNSDLNELARPRTAGNRRSRKRQIIDPRHRTPLMQNAGLLTYLRQDHPLRRHSPAVQAHRQGAASA